MNRLTLAILFLISTVHAEELRTVPVELTNLLPDNFASLRLTGVSETESGVCRLTLSGNEQLYSATISYSEDEKATYPEKVATFQLGLNHNKKSFTATKFLIQAKSEHLAEEQYSSDSCARLEINLDGSGSIERARIQVIDRSCEKADKNRIMDRIFATKTDLACTFER